MVTEQEVVLSVNTLNEAMHSGAEPAFIVKLLRDMVVLFDGNPPITEPTFHRIIGAVEEAQTRLEMYHKKDYEHYSRVVGSVKVLSRTLKRILEYDYGSDYIQESIERHAKRFGEANTQGEM